VNAIDRVRLLASQHDHRRTFHPPFDAGDVTREDEVERCARSREPEPVIRQMPFEEPLRLRLGIGQEQRCGCHCCC